MIASKNTLAFCLVVISALSADANIRGAQDDAMIVPDRQLEEKCVGGMWVSDETLAPTNAPTDAPRTIQRTSAGIGRGRTSTGGGRGRTSTGGGRGRTSTGGGRGRGRGRGGRALDEDECVEDTPMTKSSPPGTKGDPHFKTHGGEMYDFHGGCDLVLVDSPVFSNGLGLMVHIRTKISTWWSYVESSVVRIGEETVEISGGDSTNWLYINGAPIEPLEDEEWHKIKLDNFYIRVQKQGGNHVAKLYVDGNLEFLSMRTYNDFVKVEMSSGGNALDGSLGLLGQFPLGKRVGRDGATLIEDVNEFGQHWQVKPDEPKLFHSYEDSWIVPAEQKCAMPMETMEKQQLRNRRLAESGLTMDMVEQACAHLESEDDREACVADVLATQDINMASGGVW